MKISREEMKSYLNGLMNEMSVNKDLSLELISMLKNRIQLNKIQDMLYAKNCHVSISDDDLYWILQGLDTLKESNKLGDVELPNLNKDFTEREIYEFESKFIKLEKEETNVLELDGAFEVESYKVYFIPKISAKELKSIFDNNFVLYNFDTQRDATIKDIKIAKVFTPTLNKKNIKEIKEAMKKGTFVPNTITLNVLMNGKEKFDFKEETNVGGCSIGKFLFEKGDGSILNITDGYHRSNALFELLDEDESFEMYMHLKITIFTVDEAQNYIRQESQGMKISEVTQKRFNSDLYNETIKFLNTLGGKDSNVLYNKLAKNMDAIKDTNICDYDVFRDSLEESYQIEKVYDARNISNYLKDFYNELSYILKENFDKIEQTDKVTKSNNIFILYNYLSSKLFNHSDWRDELNNIITSLNFSIENPTWEKLKISNKRITKKNRKAIYSYVDTIFELLEGGNQH